MFWQGFWEIFAGPDFNNLADAGPEPESSTDIKLQRRASGKKRRVGNEKAKRKMETKTESETKRKKQGAENQKTNRRENGSEK